MANWRMGAGGPAGQTFASGNKWVYPLGWLMWSSSSGAEYVTNRAACTLKGIQLYLTANTLNQSHNWRHWINGATGTCNVSVAASASGLIEDFVNSDTLAAGDTWGFYVFTSATSGTGTYTIVGTAVTGTAGGHIGSCGGESQGVSLTRYSCPIGYINPTSTETKAQVTMRSAVTLSRMSFYVSSNTLTASTTVRSRIDGVNGNQEISIAASGTGRFEEDDGITDVLTAGKKFNYSVVTQAGGTSIMIRNSAVLCSSTSGLRTGAGTGGAGTLAANITRYMGIHGSSPQYPGSTEAPCQMHTIVAGGLKNGYVAMNANSINGTSTFKTRKNTADGNIVVSVTASATGFFEDQVNTDSFDDDDLINFVYNIGGSSGTMSPTVVAVEFTLSTANTKTLTDSMSLSDIVRRMPGKVRSESMTLTQQALKRVTSKMVTSHSITLSDVTRRTTSKKMPSHSISLSDVLTKFRTLRKTLSDTITLTQQTLKRFVYKKVPGHSITMTQGHKLMPMKRRSETITLTQQPFYKTMMKRRTETITLTQQALKKVISRIMPSHTITLTQGFFKLPKKLMPSHTITLTQGFLKMPMKRISESITLTQQALKKFIYTKITSHTINISDVVRRLKSFTRTESITMTQGFSKMPMKRRSESMSLTDVLRKFDSIKIPSHTITLSDIFRKIGAKTRSESVTLTQGFSKMPMKKQSDNISLTDILRKLTYKRLPSDTVSLSDWAKAVKATFRTLTESINLSDILTRLTNKIAQDTITLSDWIEAKLEMIYQSCLETITLTDQMIRTRLKEFLESVSLSDVDITRLFMKRVTEEMTINKSVHKWIEGYSDDVACEWRTDHWEYHVLDWPDLYIGYLSTLQNKDGMGLRFTSVGIPVGAKITSARMKFTVRYGNTGTGVCTRFTGERSVNGATFSDWDNFMNRRGTVLGGEDDSHVFIDDQITWDNIPDGGTELPYYTPEINTIIQKIVDQPAWTGMYGGDTVVLYWDDFEGRSTAASGTCRTVASYNDLGTGDPPWPISPVYKRPQLYIEYETTVPVTKLVLKFPFTEGINLSDTWSHIVAWAKELTEIIDIEDLTVRFIVKLLQDEYMSLTDTLNKFVGHIISNTVNLVQGFFNMPMKRITESITLSDASVRRSMTRAIWNTIIVSDSIRRTVGKRISETITMTDPVVGRFKFALKVLLENITNTDSLKRFIDKRTSEAVSLVDMIIKAVTKKPLTENITLTGWTDALKAAFIYLSETINLSTSFVKSLQRTISENINLTEVIQKYTPRVFTQTITLTQNFGKMVMKPFSERMGLIQRGVTSTEDFEWGNDGDAIPPYGGTIPWISYVPGISNVEIDTSQKYSGTRSCRIYDNNRHYPYLGWIVPSQDQTTVKFRARATDGAEWNFHWSNSQRQPYIYCDGSWGGSDNICVIYGPATGQTYMDTGFHCNPGTWYQIELRNIDWTNNQFELWVENTFIGSYPMWENAYWYDYMIFSGCAIGFDWWFDDIQVIWNRPKLTLTKQPFTETISLVETFIKFIPKVFTQTITLTEKFTKQIPKLFIEGISLADSFRKAIMKRFQETITITQSFFQAYRFVGRILSETITLTQQFGKVIMKRFTEGLSLADQLRRAITKAVFQENITLADVIHALKGYFRTLQETITNSDVLRKAITTIKTETYSLVDTVTKIMKIRLPADVINMSDQAVQKTKTQFKILMETIGLTDLLVDLQKLLKYVNLSETMNIIDSVYKDMTTSFTEIMTLIGTVTKLIYRRPLQETITLTVQFSKWFGQLIISGGFRWARFVQRKLSGFFSDR